MKTPGRPAQRHRHPADAGHARGDGGGAAGRRRVRRRPQRQRAAGEDRRDARASRPRCSCRPARRATCARILSHCQRGDEYIVGQMQHCYRWEGGGAAVFGSVQPQPLNHQPDGTLALADIEAAIKPDDPHFARTRLLALENTLGGKLLPMAYLQQATALARSQGPGDATSMAPGCSTRRSRRRADRQRCRAREARRIARPVRQRLGVLQQGPGRAGRLGAVRLARPDRPRPPHPQDGRRRDAPGRHAGRGGRVRAGPPRRAPGAGPCAGAAPGRGPGGHRRAAGGAAADQHRLRRPGGAGAGAVRRAAGAPGASRACWPPGLYRLRFVTHLDVDAAGVDRAVAAIRRSSSA